MGNRFETNLIWKRIEKLDPQEVSLRSLARYDAKMRSYLINILSQEYAAELNEHKITAIGKTKEEAPWELQILIPIYLVNAKNEGLSGEWISPNELEGGSLFFSASAHNLAFDDILDKYLTPNEFLRAGLSLGGERIQVGDAAFTILILPRIPILYVFRSGGGEFPNSINVYFDSSVKSHLPTDSIWLIIEYSRKILCKTGSNSQDLLI